MGKRRKGLLIGPSVRVRKTKGTPRLDWSTPRALVRRIASTLGFEAFDLDPCATPQTAKAATWYSPVDNGLVQPWPGRVWCNPPFGTKNCFRWLTKGLDELDAGRCSLLVFLATPRTDQPWYHKAKASRWYLGTIEIEDRVQFETDGVASDNNNSLTIVMVFGRLEKRPVGARWSWSLSLPATETTDIRRLL